jgi:hypothetical protein
MPFTSLTCLSGVRTQAVSSAEASIAGWKENTEASRARAIEAAKEASEAAQLAHKFMRNMAATKA